MSKLFTRDNATQFSYGSALAIEVENSLLLFYTWLIFTKCVLTSGHVSLFNILLNVLLDHVAVVAGSCSGQHRIELVSLLGLPSVVEADDEDDEKED